jgi:hypothetical protein
MRLTYPGSVPDSRASVRGSLGVPIVGGTCLFPLPPSPAPTGSGGGGGLTSPSRCTPEAQRRGQTPSQAAVDGVSKGWSWPPPLVGTAFALLHPGA